MWNGDGCRECGFEGFSKRVSNFSLGLRAIRPSELRAIHEIGVSSYLSFTLCLSVFTMFELIEVVSGRLIGPKTWDRNVRIFEALSMQSVVV